MEFNRVFQTIDAHAAGEPLRIIVSGVPPIPGSTMLEKRQYMREHLDRIRTILMLEPRGHNDMYGCVITPAVSEGSDLGVLFMHNEGYSTMCGHGVIALVTVAVQNGLVRDPSRVVLDTPAGRVRAWTTMEEDRVRQVTFENVPSFVFRRDLEVEGFRLDVVYGGAFYALVPSPVPIDSEHLSELRGLGMKLKHAVERTLRVVHPLEPGLEGIYGTIFTGPAVDPKAHLRNVTIFADAEVDRSPCGTGTCGVMAARFARGRLRVGEAFVHESLIGTVFTGTVLQQARVADFDAIIPTIAGSAHVTGFHTFIVDPDDAAGQGFRIDAPPRSPS